MLAFTESHPKLKRFSVLRLDARFVAEKQTLPVIEEEDASREYLASQLSAPRATAVPVGDSQPGLKEASLND